MRAMRSSSVSPPRHAGACPVCGCTCSYLSPSAAFRRPLLSPTARRSLDLEGSRPPPLDLLNLASPAADPSGTIRVGSEHECVALRQALASQHQTIQDLYRDLEEERSASSTAANEAMSMILRIQREKAEVHMEYRQFKQFAEDKIAHDQQQMAALEDECYRREQAIQTMLHELRVYKHRLESHGIDPADGNDAAYPQLRCLPPPNTVTVEEMVEKYTAGDSPQDQLMEIEQRIGWMERMDSGEFDEMEKVVVGNSPRLSRHSRRFSMESAASFAMPEIAHGRGSEADDASDVLYTVEAIHGIKTVSDDCMSTPRGSVARGSAGVEEADIRKLYTRLQVLEADRESLKQAIVSMRTEKAQMILLKEIAQNLSKGLVVSQPSPERIISKKPFCFGLFTFISALKFAFSLAFWTKKTTRSRYMFHLVNGRVGVLILLDKSPHVKHIRFITRPIISGESSKTL